MFFFYLLVSFFCLMWSRHFISWWSFDIILQLVKYIHWILIWFAWIWLNKIKENHWTVLASNWICVIDRLHRLRRRSCCCRSRRFINTQFIYRALQSFYPLKTHFFLNEEMTLYPPQKNSNIKNEIKKMPSKWKIWMV